MKNKRSTLKSYIELYNTGIDNSNSINSILKNSEVDFPLPILIDTICMIRHPTPEIMDMIYTQVVKYNTMLLKVDESVPPWCKLLLALSRKEDIIPFFYHLELLPAISFFDAELHQYIDAHAIPMTDTLVSKTYGYNFCTLLKSIYPDKYPGFEQLVLMDLKPWSIFSDIMVDIEPVDIPENL